METDLVDVPRGYLSGPMKEVIVGAAGGITQVLIGQPFDIVKVRMQTQANTSAAHLARNIWRQEGPLAFYKGTLPPLLGVGACISIVYTSFHPFSTALHSLTPDRPSLTLPQTYLAGGLAGLTNSAISGPMEHIRIRLQTQSATSSQTYTSARDCIRRIVQQSGPAGLYRGHSATMLREFHSYGVWFSVFEVLMAATMRAEDKPRDQIAGWKIAACGALTGEVLWTVNYPFDVVKSKMQADGFGVDRRVEAVHPHQVEKAKGLQSVCWGDEYERMISGMLYSPVAPELIEGRLRARRLMAEFNTPPDPDTPAVETSSRRETILRSLVGRASGDVYIEPPLFVDYGCNISVGDGFYANFNLTVLDCGLVTIGDHVEIGPNVNIITGEHETDIEARRAHRGLEFTREIVIGNDCWIGANVTILGGVTIGEGSSVGAGSVVKRDVPPFSVVVGNPARVVRSARKEV
ncbi:sugar O-acetyltransferase [Aspergillus terreus]|uniref:Sugar O-acetyltransferase n=1 Tax=Aspergillus terreus TaxID=33178 RepID=A0A5M3Z4F7_ASPTE|nr:hypothetical protein ATETN484_0008039600 [Aspergillus terreus]GFF21224.1 sugar O-acetyltransferase [Aspergillus terreus]